MNLLLPQFKILNSSDLFFISGLQIQVQKRVSWKANISPHDCPKKRRKWYQPIGINTVITKSNEIGAQLASYRNIC